MTETAQTWDINWIQSMLPHRYPFLLVDRVLEMVPDKRIVAIKNVTINEEFFVGHFPGHPVMPGVLIIEGMAQAAGILHMAEREDRDKEILYFMGIDKARFRKPVRTEVDVRALYVPDPEGDLRYVMDAVRLIRRELDGRVIGAGKRGPVTEKLQAMYFDAVKGKLAEHSGWLTHVKG